MSAGYTEGSISFHATYLVDQRTQACWFLMSPSYSPSPLSCCAARRVREVRSLVTWESDESCTQAAAPAEPATPGAPHP